MLSLVKPPPPAPPPTPPDLPDLHSAPLAEYLRAGDDRMVRPTAGDVTSRRRAEPHVTAILDGVLGELIGATSAHGTDLSHPPLARAKAAEVLTLLATDSPDTRAKLGAATGVTTALIDLVDRSWRHAAAFDRAISLESTTATFVAAEAAAEAIWILTFASPANHAAFVREGAVRHRRRPAARAHRWRARAHTHAHARTRPSSHTSSPLAAAAPQVEALAGVVTAEAALSVVVPARATMWAAAALQNLAASYCATADGRGAAGPRCGCDRACHAV